MLSLPWPLQSTHAEGKHSTHRFVIDRWFLGATRGCEDPCLPSRGLLIGPSFFVGWFSLPSDVTNCGHTELLCCQ